MVPSRATTGCSPETARGGDTLWGMDLAPEVLDDLQKRLRRAEGQIRGVQQMLADGRDCREVVTQLSAAINALEQAGFRLVASGLTWCLTNPEEAGEGGYSVDEVQRLFMKLT